MKGYFQRVLSIDLTNRTTETDPLDEDLLRGYVGGKGLASQLLLERNPANVDSFAPENHIIIALGPVTDSAIYGSCRHGLFTKSPLTGFFGESYAGGRLAVPISRTGYDAIIIEGASQEPVWLEITDRDVTFHDAADLWGKGTYATEDEIKQEIGIPDAGVMVIGPPEKIEFALRWWKMITGAPQEGPVWALF